MDISSLPDKQKVMEAKHKYDEAKREWEKIQKDILTVFPRGDSNMSSFYDNCVKWNPKTQHNVKDITKIPQEYLRIEPNMTKINALKEIGFITDEEFNEWFTKSTVYEMKVEKLRGLAERD